MHVMRKPAEASPVAQAGDPAARGRDARPETGLRRILADVVADIVREVVSGDLAGSSSTARGTDAGPATATERILAEVLADVMRVERVSVDGHFFEDLGADSLVMAHFCARVRKRADLPSVSMKDIYRHPTIRRLATVVAGTATAPVESPIERMLAEVLADILRLERVPVDSHFFDDLGADSLVMAHFCARVRKRTDLPRVAMKDIYRHPTIGGLAAALAGAAPTPSTPSIAGSIEVAAPASRLEYVLCGTLQLLSFLGYACVVALVMSRGYDWISLGTGVADVYLRSVLFGGASVLGMCTVPIVAKWVLIGRWKPQQIRIWSLAYFRFWLVRTLIRANPLLLMVVGSPLYVLYLRALGAKVGRGVAIFSRTVPVCTDLLTIGDGTVIRKESFFTGYRALAGLIQTGAVTLGRDVFVGEKTVLDIDTSMGDRAQLGHASSLHAGQAVPECERWHGSPAQRTAVDYRAVDPTRCGTLRRAVYSVNQLLMLLALYMPLTIGLVGVLSDRVLRPTALLSAGAGDLMRWTFYGDVLAVSFALFFGAVLVGLSLVVTAPRLLNLAITPGRVYRLYGLHYSVHRAIVRITNLRFFPYLFGDSSYIVHYLRCLGYDLSRAEQTGSNFGMGVAQDSPYLCSVGRGTMIADGLSIINADFSSTSFRVARVSIGSHNFLGNSIAYPSQGRTGDNCLLATKVMVPIDGAVREDVGLLGSPSFEIPRSVVRDSRFDHLRSGDELRRRLAAKNRYNLRTMGLTLLVRWIHFFGITLLTTAMAVFYPRFGWEAVAVEMLLAPLYTVAYFVLVERAATRFQPLRPRYCSIYDPYFWWHERYWKLVIAGRLDRVLSGTPLKNVVSRLLGVRLGRRVFDDGCDIPERTLATIGDDCALNAGSGIQCHSQEDGAFKSDRTTIGAGCTIGIGALVHYGVTMGDGAVLAPDSFLMKGEEVPPHARWGGNPAGEGRDDQDQPAGHQLSAMGGFTTLAIAGGTELVGRPSPRRRGRAAKSAAGGPGSTGTVATVGGGKTRWER
jgi:non-ribosomal peptide synthetase-like protein